MHKNREYHMTFVVKIKPAHMKRILKPTQQLLLIILIIGQAYSCSHEEIATGSTTGSGEYDITFSVRLPSNSSITKSLTTDDETEIKELQVLAFEPNDGVLKHISYAKALGSSGSSEQKFTAKLRTGKFDLMVLANSDEYIANYFPKTILSGSTRATVIETLQMELNDKWNTASASAGYKPIPMWGIKEGVQVSKESNLTGDNAFDVTRVLAKVNVKIALESGQQGTFELVSVRYHNRRTKGQLIPNDWNPANTHVQKPSLVKNDIGIEAPLLYEGATCENEIYILETPAGSKNEHPKYPCLVVGGKYNGVLGYYRIDFANKEGENSNYIPILRNHTYDIIITQVDGYGFPDPDDAYNSVSVNMEAKIIDWYPNTIGDIYFDGLNYLSIERGRYELSWKAYLDKTLENTVKIKTDHKDGWKVESIEYKGSDKDWLSLQDSDSGIKDEESERWLKIQTPNTSQETRVATITIAVGRIRGKIIVLQESSPALDLIIRDKDGNIIEDGAVIAYKSDNWTEQECQYSLEWFPANATANATLEKNIQGYKPMEFSDESKMLQTGNMSNTTGERSFEFTIKPFDTSVTKANGAIDLDQVSAIRYKFEIQDSKGGMITKTFTVENHLIDVQATKIGACKQGRFYEFEVAYNTPWQLTIDGVSEVLDSRTLDLLPTDGGIEGQTGKRTIRLKLEIDKNHDGKEAYFSFSKPNTAAGENIYDKVKVKSLYNHPNSYIVKPGSSLEFSIVKAYRVWESELINQPLTGRSGTPEAKIIWADHSSSQNIINTLNMSIDHYSPEGSIIKITAGNQEGNAVIGLFLENNIVWSWHIWVTNYDPDIYYKSYNNSGIVTTLMDRNLGAWTDDFGSNEANVRSYGLYYQWGRKDPFPGPDGSKTEEKLGDGNITIDWPAKLYVETAASPSSNNLIESIEHPYLFYLSGTDPYDWYTNSSNGYNNELWTDYDQLKSDFDPSPDGWRLANRFWIDKQYYFTWAFNPIDGSDGKGWDYNSGDAPVGKYPTSGYIDYQSGEYKMVKQECWLWYGCHDVGQTKMDGDVDPRSEDERYAIADKTYFFHTSSTGWVNKRERPRVYKAGGMPVRCEKDDNRYHPKW